MSDKEKNTIIKCTTDIENHTNMVDTRALKEYFGQHEHT